MREGRFVHWLFLPALTPRVRLLTYVAFCSLLFLGGAAIAQPVGRPRSPRGAGQSSPASGPDVRINDPGDADEEGPPCNIQSEVSIARWGERVVAGWNDGSQCKRLILGRQGLDDRRGLSLSGYGYSGDGGRTWKDGGLLKVPDATLLGDPVLAAGPQPPPATAPDGVFYYATLMATPKLQVVVASSEDGGRNWDPPVHVSKGRDPSADHDKPWLAVDATDSPHRGNVYVAWTEFVPGTGCIGLAADFSCAVLFSRSTDGGRTFSEPIKLSVATDDPVIGDGPKEYPGAGVQVAVGPRGEVYVGWVETQSTRPRHIWVSRSLDGGVTFEPPGYVGEAGNIGHTRDSCVTLGETSPEGRRFVINGDIRIANWLSMAVDTSGSSDPGSPEYNPYRGNIYLAVPHDHDPSQSPIPLNDVTEVVTNRDESDIAFLYSEDRGSTWLNVDKTKARPAFPFDYPPTFVVNDDVDESGSRTQTDQFHPQVAVDSYGRVAVSWYDRRVSNPMNWDMEMYATVSFDGGKTFSDNFAVSDESFPPARTNPNAGGLSGCYMGEYNGMVGGASEFLLAWGDNRDGNDVHPDPNVYFDRITLGPTG